MELLVFVISICLTISDNVLYTPDQYKTCGGCRKDMYAGRFVYCNGYYAGSTKTDCEWSGGSGNCTFTPITRITLNECAALCANDVGCWYYTNYYDRICNLHFMTQCNVQSSGASGTVCEKTSSHSTTSTTSATSTTSTTSTISTSSTSTTSTTPQCTEYLTSNVDIEFAETRGVNVFYYTFPCGANQVYYFDEGATQIQIKTTIERTAGSPFIVTLTSSSDQWPSGSFNVETLLKSIGTNVNGRGWGGIFYKADTGDWSNWNAKYYIRIVSESPFQSPLTGDHSNSNKSPYETREAGLIGCGQTRTGVRTSDIDMPIYKYEERVLARTQVYLEGCASTHNIWLYLFDKQGNLIYNVDHQRNHGSQTGCGNYYAGDITVQTSVAKGDVYYFGIGSYDSSVGDYSVTLECSPDGTLLNSNTNVKFAYTTGNGTFYYIFPNGANEVYEFDAAATSIQVKTENSYDQWYIATVNPGDEAWPIGTSFNVETLLKTIGTNVNGRGWGGIFYKSNSDDWSNWVQDHYIRIIVPTRRRMMNENMYSLQMQLSPSALTLAGILFGLIVICGVSLSYYTCKINSASISTLKIDFIQSESEANVIDV